MKLEFSFIIPVFNRPDEIEELLSSFTNLNTSSEFEIVIVEDGSTLDSKAIIDTFQSQLNINYVVKENTGPGDSRNFGMRIAKGNYFIILDSDCILPESYLVEVEKYLSTNYVDCFGGPDAAHDSFSNIQIAINFAMTSVISTGGIRGNKNSVDKFQPRSFNMGLSKKAFLDSNGFGNIHPGEDPDLSIRLWNMGYKTALIPTAFVYHKRRISWRKFYTQVNKFGMVRPILNQWRPKTRKITYWFPSLFILGFLGALILGIFYNYYLVLQLYALYFSIVFISALLSTKSISVAFQSILAICIQFIGYGIGFLKATFVVGWLKRNPQTVFPKLFFKVN